MSDNDRFENPPYGQPGHDYGDGSVEHIPSHPDWSKDSPTSNWPAGHDNHPNPNNPVTMDDFEPEPPSKS